MEDRTPRAGRGDAELLAQPTDNHAGIRRRKAVDAGALEHATAQPDGHHGLALRLGAPDNLPHELVLGDKQGAGSTGDNHRIPMLSSGVDEEQVRQQEFTAFASHFTVALAGGHDLDTDRTQLAPQGAYRPDVRLGGRQYCQNAPKDCAAGRSQRRPVFEERNSHLPDET